MGWKGMALAAAALWAALGLAAQATAVQENFEGQRGSGEVRRLTGWILETVDHGSLPFAIVDKINARIFVFDGAGRLRGDSAVLLGQAAGDESAAGVGDRAQAGHIPRHQRTTPAGRFVSQPGRNRKGEHVVWVDYESAFAIHRLRPGSSKRQREASLASGTPRDRRASLGCVVVPVGFYSSVVARFLGRGRAMVYVLPESRPARDLFSAL